MRILMTRTYEMTVDDLDQFDRIAEDWDEDRIILDSHGPFDRISRQVEVLTSAIDGGDLSGVAMVKDHAILHIA